MGCFLRFTENSDFPSAHTGWPVVGPFLNMVISSISHSVLPSQNKSQVVDMCRRIVCTVS